MNENVIAKAVELYSPVVYLHSKEQYFPVDFNEYINQSRLKHISTNTIYRPEDEFNADIFADYLKKDRKLNNGEYSLFLPNGIDSPIIKDYHPDEKELQDVPLYYRVHNWKKYNIYGDTMFYISFAHMYAYNGPLELFGVRNCCLPIMDKYIHFADLEHITIKCVLKSQGDLLLEEVFYCKHGNGDWVDSSKLQFENVTHPVVYSALNSHASYEKPGNSLRYWCIVERCDKGHRWVPNKLIRLYDNVDNMPKGLQWMFFNGDLGDGHVGNFPMQTGFFHPEKNSSWGEGCCWILDQKHRQDAIRSLNNY